jgi:predicted enzyme related to lactoylglutathione lyase
MRMVVVVMSVLSAGCRESRSVAPTAGKHGDAAMVIHYLEVVTEEVDASCELFAQLHGLSFGPPDPDLGQARVAERPDGGLVGIRSPLAEHEAPIVRTYLAVDDIEQAVEVAERRGATIAYPPTRQGKRGTFAIFIEGDVQHGLWQR